MDADVEKVRAIVHRAARDARDEADLLGYLFGEAKPLWLVGTIRQPAAPKAKPHPGSTSPEMPMGVPAADCGSPKGAQAHHRAGEQLCEVCQAWSQERHRRTRVAPGAHCGTAKGAQMHRQLGEPICQPCRAAESAKSSERHAATYKPKPRNPGTARKHPLPEERTATARDRNLLLLAAYGAISCRDAHYLTAAGDDVTAHLAALSKAGWVNLRARTERPVLTVAGYVVIDPSTRGGDAAAADPGPGPRVAAPE